jgi:hypothetical protein
MSELLSRFNSGELLIFIGICATVLCSLSCTIGKCWVKLRQVELKKDMLDRGMSADEITVVLEAGLKK